MANAVGKLKTKFWRLSMTGLTLGPNITRYYMYEHLRALAKSFPTMEGDVLCVSGSRRLCDTMHIRPTSYVDADYPEHNLLALNFADESFDFVMSDQVLEHVEGDPQLAFDETWRVLRPGGIAIHTTVFNYSYHPCPGDYWRFSPEGLKLLTKGFARVLDYGGWGNFKASCLLRSDLRFVGIPRVEWHPLNRMAMENDPTWPIVSWVVVQK